MAFLSSLLLWLWMPFITAFLDFKAFGFRRVKSRDFLLCFRHHLHEKPKALGFRGKEVTSDLLQKSSVRWRGEEELGNRVKGSNMRVLKTSWHYMGPKYHSRHWLFTDCNGKKVYHNLTVGRSGCCLLNSVINVSITKSETEVMCIKCDAIESTQHQLWIFPTKIFNLKSAFISHLHFTENTG